VSSAFLGGKVFAFFAKISLVTEYAGFSGRLKTGAPSGQL
jgi:hypothetical protein